MAVEPIVPAGSVVPAMRLLVVRGFARCMTGIDSRTEVPPTGLHRHRRPPFIYSDEQVLALIERARTAIRQRLVSATCETLIGVLAATGMRIGEAISSTTPTSTAGVLLVRESKFNKSRYLPVQASTLDRSRATPVVQPCRSSQAGQGARLNPPTSATGS